MTDFTRPATWDDLKRVAQLLNDAGVRYALIGGHAIAAHGYNRFTEDLDTWSIRRPEHSRVDPRVE